VPGAVVFALVMLGVRPAGAAYLPGALETSSQRYGPIGVAFTYLGWLYVVAFCFLAAAVVGRVLAEDEGRLGRLIRDRRPTGLAGR
jgi:membrane protein